MSESGYPDDNPKTAFGVRKVPLHLIPPTGLVHEARAFADGAAKYGPYNWRDKTVSSSVYVGAALRHLLAWWDGQDTDPQSSVNHLGHARACLNILLDAQANGKLNDDRPPRGRTAELLALFEPKSS